MKYIDTHGHILFERLTDDESKEQLNRFKESDVEKVILPGTTEDDSFKNVKLSDGERIFAAVGVHPSYAFNLQVVDFLDDFDYSNVVAIGECGLDYYYKENPPREVQQQVFIKQLEIAKKHNLPVLIHCRDAIEDMYEILSREEHKGIKFVMHSYAGGLEWLDRFNELGAYYSFNGITTFKKSLEHQETAKKVPLDKIVVETDSPFLTPVPFRGKTNEPAYVKYVADFVASIRDEDDEVVLKALWDNSHKLLNIKN